MSATSRFTSYIVPVTLLTAGVFTVASAQSSSPFANKKKKQAWEQPQVTQPAPQPATTYPQPTYTEPTYTQPSYSAPSYPSSQTMERRPASSDYPVVTSSQPATTTGYNYQPPAQTGFPQAQELSSSTPAYGQPSSGISGAQSGAYNSGSRPGGYIPNPYEGPTGPDVQGQSEPYNPTPRAWRQPQYPQGQYQQGQYSQGQYPGGQVGQQTNRKRSWKDKLGFGNWKSKFSGQGRVGVAATERDGWSEDFIADADVEFEASTVTQGGLEYGINLGARAQYDKYRRGFGRRLPDCPPTTPGCASVDIDGTPTALRGHTSQFYSFGPDNAKEAEVQLESAYLFLRSAYGDVTLGRDDGAAYLFSLGAPSLLAVGASNSPVDYTGLDSVKTVNDASGFSEKITYTSPRLLGDTVGVGVQVGASYALNARACGVDYCVKRNDGTGAATPDLKDIMEVGIALDRTFDNGLKVEGTATYARGSEETGLEAFDDLSAYNVGLEVSLSDWTVGGSWLKSNNALANGDYEAWDAGLTWKPSQLGFTLGYGQAMDENVQLKSNQGVFGVTYDVNERFTLGTGVQYIERKTPMLNAGVLDMEKEKATSIFVEGGFKF